MCQHHHQETTKADSKHRIIGMILVSACVLTTFVIATTPADAQKSTAEINQEIEAQKQKIDGIKKQIQDYENKIRQQQRESNTLGNQLAILGNQVAKVELDIAASEAEIKQTSLEIQSLNQQILAAQQSIATQKERLGEYLRLLDQQDDIGYLEVVISNSSFSEFFDYLQSIEQLQGNINTALTDLSRTKQRLEIDRANLETKKQQEEDLKSQLLAQRSQLDERHQAQEILLAQSRLGERQFRNQLYQLQLEQQQINADIASLEKRLRDELAKQQDKNIPTGPARLAWPVDPTRGITTYFHDPDYPFRYVYEHPGLDIRSPQGSAIKAPENGYVAKVKFAGDTSYAYIMLLHNDGFSTVFGHVSRVDVREEEFVTKGQVIGASGGKPGGIGSGNMTTGPHLHFEVRLNGIPVNPLDYLPGF